MDLNKAEELCKELMNKHGLSHWKFQYDNSIRRFGVCKYNTYNESGVIGLSKKLVAVNEEKQVRDTILHEIAHVSIGVESHDIMFRDELIRLTRAHISVEYAALLHGVFTGVGLAMSPWPASTARR